MELILGSQSPRRRELLERMGLSFRVLSAEIDETKYETDDPESSVLRICEAKAAAVARKIQNTECKMQNAECKVQNDGAGDAGTALCRPQEAEGSPIPSLPLEGKVPPQGADEVELRQAIAIDEPHRATGPTSSVTASPCHLPLEGKAEDGERETQILRCAQNDGAGDAGTALCRPQEALILSSDTVVVLDGKIMGKPHDAAEARAMLAALSGREHEVYTAFCLLPIEMQNAERNAQNAVCHCEKTYVKFRALTPEEIAAYVATGEPMDKAGAYGIQNLGAMLVESIRGDYFTVMGLPVCQLALALKGFGIDPLLRQENKS